MPLKKPSQQKNKLDVSPHQAAILADQLADKPYGKKPLISTSDTDKEIARTTISLPKKLIEKLEDIAITNKRQGDGQKSTSAIIRAALEHYFELKKY